MISRRHVLSVEREHGRSNFLRRRLNLQNQLVAGGESGFAAYLGKLQELMSFSQNVDFTDSDILLVIDMQRDFVPNSHDDNTASTFGVAGGDTIVPEIARLCTRFLSGDRGYVVATRDYHPANHASFVGEQPFPSHCVQGTPGADIVPAIARSLATSGKKNTPIELHSRARITFKGFSPETDSFGGVKYSDAYTNRGVCTANFCAVRSGAFDLPTSGHRVIDQTAIFGSPAGIMPGTGNVNAPPDIQFARPNLEESRLEKLDMVKDATSVFIVGLALDFCVVDTAINLSKQRANVYIVVDLCRPAFVQGNYLTSPADFAKRLKGHNVKLISFSEMRNVPSLREEYHGFNPSKTKKTKKKNTTGLIQVRRRRRRRRIPRV